MESSVRLFVFFVLSFVLSLSISYGYSSFYNKTIFSTKTPYFWTKNVHEIFEEDSETFFDIDERSCQVFHISAVLRHGTRYPQINWIQKMKKLHQKLKSENIDSKFTFLSSFPEENEGILSKLGEMEHFELGKRFGTRFKLLFEEDLDNVKFFVSSKQRASSSAEFFHKGLTEKVAQDDDETVYEHTTDDIMLRFHDNCDKYITTIDNNKTAMSEYNKFKNGTEIKDVVSAVNKRLNNGKDDTFSTDEVLVLHQICAFETAFHNSSEWCKYFKEEDLEVIEYLFDLKQYWKKVYGYKLNWEMSCPLVSHAFKEMDAATKHYSNEEEYTVGIFRFGHAETVAPLYAVFGLFNDTEILSADNYQSQKNRKFRSSHLMQFSMNIAFALYDCDEEKSEENVDHVFSNIFMKIFVNEDAVVIPACGQKLCRYNDVREKLKEKIDNCNFQKMCSTKSSNHDEL